MKVLPQKKKQEIKYPKIGAVCKTTAALTLTAATVFSISACSDLSVKKGSGSLIKSKVNAPYDEPDIVGGMDEPPPECYSIHDQGVYVTPEWQYGTNSYNLLDDESEIVITSGDYFLVNGLTFDQIDADSEFMERFPADKFEFFDLSSGYLLGIARNADYYLEHLEILGGLVEMDPDTLWYKCSDNRTVEICSYDGSSEEFVYALTSGDDIHINDEFYMAYNVTTSDIESESEFATAFPRSEYSYFDTTEGNIIIIKHDTDFFIECLVIDGELAADEI